MGSSGAPRARREGEGARGEGSPVIDLNCAPYLHVKKTSGGGEGDTWPGKHENGHAKMEPGHLPG